MVHRQIGKYLAVELDILFAELVDQARISDAIDPGAGIDTGNPQAAECALFALAVAVSELHTPFEGRFGYRVDFATGAKVAACGFENFLASLA